MPKMPTRRLNLVTLLAALIGLAGLFGTSWLLVKANRLLAGDVYGAFAVSDAVSLPLATGLAAAWALLALASLLRFPGRGWVLATLASVGLVGAAFLVGLGSSALSLASSDPERTRVSLQGGLWLSVLAYYIGVFGALGDAPDRPWVRAVFVAPGPLIVLVLVARGLFAHLGLSQELASQGGDFVAELLRHLGLATTSVVLACLIGIPAAIWAARREGAARVILPFASFLQTIPSLALFGIMLSPLARLGSGVTVLQALVFSLGGLLAALLIRFLATRAARVQGRVLTLLALLIALPPLLLLGTVLAVFLNDAFVALFSWNASALQLPQRLDATLSSLGVRGIGTAPALIALTLYAFLPVVRNTYTGLKEVPQAATEAGRGMGMSEGQILRRVELPLALPLIFEGVRASVVLTIGIATVAFLIGAGGLGTFIERGISQQVPDLILLGALPIILLALLADALLRALGILVTPRGIR